MKSLFLLLMLSITSLTYARAKIPVCFPCENLELVKDLPQDELLKQGNDYLNLGYLYEEYGVAWIPAWTKKGRYVLINTAKDEYYDLSEEQLAELSKLYEFDANENPLGFWKKIGGKILIAIILAFIIYGYIPRKNKNVAPTES